MLSILRNQTRNRVITTEMCFHTLKISQMRPIILHYSILCCLPQRVFMTQYGCDIISYVMPWTNIAKTFRVTINTHTIVAQRDRVCSVKCIKFGHKMPGAMNALTLSQYSARCDRVRLRVTKNTRVILAR